MGGPDILFYFEQSQASSLSGLLQPFILLDGHESGVCVCVYTSSLKLFQHVVFRLYSAYVTSVQCVQTSAKNCALSSRTPSECGLGNGTINSCI